MPWVLEIRKEDLSVADRLVVEDGVLTLGRQDCDINLDDTKISKNHCTFYLHGGQFTLVDNSSTNGTFVNGHRIDKRDLRNNDIIIVGSTNIKVVNEQ